MTPMDRRWSGPLPTPRVAQATLSPSRGNTHPASRRPTARRGGESYGLRHLYRRALLGSARRISFLLINKNPAL